MAMTRVDTKVASWYPACCPELLPSITKLPRLQVCEDCACAFVYFSAIMCWACTYNMTCAYYVTYWVRVCATKVITFACYTYLANGLPLYLRVTTCTLCSQWDAPRFILQPPSLRLSIVRVSGHSSSNDRDQTREYSWHSMKVVHTTRVQDEDFLHQGL